ncbi:GH116 family glycosyl-hydrolase [Cohnella sp. 56]|uniref:GH116 family glycosyl-hydrolase n=1 Tax=Cohnella sp. 56 TaxID=3113722 RepID=UPI0030E9CD7E
MRQPFTYTGKNTNEISFPLGGIGTGSIGLAGNGRLVDWEIFNRPNKGGSNGFSFFAVKAERAEKVIFAKVLHGDLAPPYHGTGDTPYAGYGHGVQRESMSGFPHFRTAAFKGQYPVAEVTFSDDEDQSGTSGHRAERSGRAASCGTSPLQAKLTAYSPFIPHADDDSSLPAAVLAYEITNVSDETLDVTVAGCMANPAAGGAVNSYEERAGFRGVRLGTSTISEEEPEYGSLTISTDMDDTSHQNYWFRGIWFDNVTVFWQEFNQPGPFKPRDYDDERKKQEHVIHNHKDTATLAGRQSIPPGESRIFRYVLTWHYPNYANYWNPGADKPPVWKNHYATRFGDSIDIAAHVWSRLDELEAHTFSFRDTLFSSSLPESVLDAVSANLSVIKSPTVARLTDGTLYGFEGNHMKEGSCEGSCTHVWNYEQVTPFLFPHLARTMREAEYRYCYFESGRMAFRMMLPPEGRDKLDFHAAADGQLGSIVRFYREWKISGDDEWLRRQWPRVKRSLAYAWSEENADKWDADRDGVLEGTQHHTLDMELYGPSSWLNGYYHAALLAAAQMADAVGDPDGNEYRELFRRGSDWVDRHLFNGDYFYQKLDLTDTRYPVDPELGQVKYQVAEGCHIDQVIGQWFAHTTGLGYIFDREKVRSALSAIYRYNFVGPMREYANACRIYALNDEKGVMICTYPHGNSPLIPIPYAGECMNGFEYQAACHMIHEGLVREGLDIVEAIRARYDGERRNPWNEFECGSNYVRSMASYGLLLALSGFSYDMRAGAIGFDPAAMPESDDEAGVSTFRCFWSMGKGWGQATIADREIGLDLRYGQLTLNLFRSPKLTRTSRIQAFVGDGAAFAEPSAMHPVACRVDADGEVCFEEPLTLKAGQRLAIRIG